MKKVTRVVDLSLPISEAMRVYPGMATPTVTRLKRHDQQGLQVSKLEIIVHAGTHVDSPRHFLPDGPTIDGMGLENLIGEAVLIDLTDLPPGGVIERKHLAEHDAEIREGDIVALHTGYQRYEDPEKYCVMDPDAARWLTGKGIKCLASDIPSVDPINRQPRASAATHPSHHALLEAGVPSWSAWSTWTGFRRQVLFLLFPFEHRGFRRRSGPGGGPGI